MKEVSKTPIKKDKQNGVIKKQMAKEIYLGIFCVYDLLYNSCTNGNECK
jgi:hypothetical protein